MTAFKEIVLSFTVSCIVAGLVIILAPEGAAGRALKITACIFVLAGIVSPEREFLGSAVSAQSGLSEEAFGSELALLSTDEIKRIAREQITGEIEAVLDTAGARNARVEVAARVQSPYEVSIVGVTLTLNAEDEEKRDGIAARVEELLGIVPEVKVGNE